MVKIPAPENVLIINVSRIGDTLLATPAIRAVAEHWPEARLTVLGHPKRVEVLEHLSFIDELGHIDKTSAPWRGHLSGKKFDLAFVYGKDQSLVSYALRVSSRVVAFAQDNDALNKKLFFAIPPAEYQSMHAAKMHLLLPESLAVTSDNLQLAYQVTTEESDWANTQIENSLESPKGPLIGLQISSFPTKPYRNWPLEHFFLLCSQLIDETSDARFLIFGGPQDIAATSKLHQYLGNKSALFAGRLSLRETAAVMSRVDLYVGVDTGPTHIAGALMVPMVALYHCKHPARCFSPQYSDRTIAIDHPALDSGDCRETSSLGEIPVGQVLASCLKLLSKRPVSLS